MKKILITLSLLYGGLNTLFAQNPVIQTHFTPDPAPQNLSEKGMEKKTLKDRQNMKKDLGCTKEKICIICSGRAVRSLNSLDIPRVKVHKDHGNTAEL